LRSSSFASTYTKVKLPPKSETAKNLTLNTEINSLIGHYFTYHDNSIPYVHVKMGNETGNEMRNGIRNEMRNEMRNEIRNKMRCKMINEIKNEIINEMRNEIRKKMRNEK